MANAGKTVQGKGRKREVDAEAVLGNIRRSHGLSRFTLRGLGKVTLEWRLVATGHSIRKPFLAESGRRAGRSIEHRAFPRRPYAGAGGHLLVSEKGLHRNRFRRSPFSWAI